MKKFVMLLGVLSVSLIAMDEMSSVIKKVQKIDGIKFIEMSSNSDIYSNYDHTMIEKLCFIYRMYFNDIKRRDLIFCTNKTFRLRLPSFYLKQFQEKQFFPIKQQIASLRNVWFFFTSDEYQQMDDKFIELYKKYRDIEKTWNEFIDYFLSDHVIKYLVNKKYSKTPLITPML